MSQVVGPLGPDEAGDYLRATNFKSLLEYISAEVVISRPDDPLTFIRNLLDNRWVLDIESCTGFQCASPSPALVDRVASD
jgi:hypothetical protein